MKHALLLLGLAALSWAQPLPLAWLDKPEGTQLFLARPRLFEGAQLDVGNDGLILAWCDARDGRARVMAQKFSLASPASPGPWQSQVEGLGLVDALAGPARPQAVFSPALATDGGDGAYLLWCEANSPSYGDLRLQRLGDGFSGAGAFLLPQDLVLTSELPLPVDDCRDPERCRGMMDNVRHLCADGSGGAWVLWRTELGQLLLQHVQADGVLDPDFPAAGLPLPIQTWNFQLLADDQGNARILHFDLESGLWLTSVGQDGQFQLPDGSRRVSAPEAQVANFAGLALAGGRSLAAWVQHGAEGQFDLRAQLLGADQAELWPPGGVWLGQASDAALALCATGDGAPYYLAHSTGTGNVALQLDDEGRLLWPQPASLDVVGDENPERITALRADGQGLFYVSNWYDIPYAQRLDPSGAQLWPAERTRLLADLHFGWPWGVFHDGPGAWSVGIGDRHNGFKTERLLRRDAQGQDLLEPAAGSLFVHQVEAELGETLLTGVADPVLALSDGGSLYALAALAHSGDSSWEGHQRPLGTTITYEQVDAVEVEDGIWLLNMAPHPTTGGKVLCLQKLDFDGHLLLERQEVFPGSSALPEFSGHSNGHLVLSQDRLYVAGMEDLSLRLQSFDPAGQRLWGERGLAVGGAAQGGQRLVGCSAAPQGGVDLAWVVPGVADRGYYLQQVDAAGQSAYPDNQECGILADADYLGWYSQTLYLALPAGGRLLVVKNGDSDLNLHALDAAGHTLWTRQLRDSLYHDVGLRLDFLGRPVVEVHQYLGDQTRLLFLRLAADGSTERAWQVPVDEHRSLLRWGWIHDGQQEALVTVHRRGWNEQGLWVQGRLLVEEEDEMPLLFDAPLTELPLESTPTILAQAPEGDLWLGWEDDHCALFGYGDQARLIRLDVLDANTGLEPAVGPAMLRLSQNHPNPFNPSTTIRFELAQAGPVRLEVFNLAGQRVRTLHEGELSAGTHSLVFDARDGEGRELGSGLYFYRLSSGASCRTERMLLLR